MDDINIFLLYIYYYSLNRQAPYVLERRFNKYTMKSIYIVDIQREAHLKSLEYLMIIITPTEKKNETRLL
jgi:hypothetical protein